MVKRPTKTTGWLAINDGEATTADGKESREREEGKIGEKRKKKRGGVF